jgi:hypothetical protein
MHKLCFSGDKNQFQTKISKQLAFHRDGESQFNVSKLPTTEILKMATIAYFAKVYQLPGKTKKYTH